MTVAGSHPTNLDITVIVCLRIDFFYLIRNVGNCHHQDWREWSIATQGHGTHFEPELLVVLRSIHGEDVEFSFIQLDVVLIRRQCPEDFVNAYGIGF